MDKTSAKIKRPLWVAGLNIALALTVGATQAFADTPITSQADLEAIGANEVTLGANYVVIESFEVVDPFAGGNTYVTGAFTGTFDGGGFTISGLTKPLFDEIGGDVSDLNLASGTGESGVIGNGALANILEAGGTIDNVSFTGDVTGIGNGVGGLVGYSGGDISNSSATGVVTGIGNDVGGLVGESTGTIDNSYATGTVDGTGDSVGGLVGYSSGDIQFSYSTGVVEGDNYVGGLVGSTGTIPNDSVITNSYASGNVTGLGEYIGGLVGDSYGTITNSYATGEVRGTGTDEEVIEDGVITVEGDYGIGGLVGYLGGTLVNTYATGNVIGFQQVGGLVGGTGFFGDIADSYATGNVTGSGDAVGGLVGLSDVTIADSFATGNVTGSGEAVGGLVGYSSGDIQFSYSTGEVEGFGDGVGGLVGGLTSGNITYSYSTGDVNGGALAVGGLVGLLGDLFGGEMPAYLSFSYASGDVNGNGYVGGLVGVSLGDIEYSLASGDVNGNEYVGGLVGTSNADISNSYSIGAVTGTGDYVGGLVGEGTFFSSIDDYSSDLSSYELLPEAYLEQALLVLNTEYEVFDITPDLNSGLPYLSANPPLEDLEMALSVLNNGYEDDPPFAITADLNSGLPYLISNPPLEDEAIEVAARIISSYLPTQILDSLRKSVGFAAAKSDLSKLDIALLEQVKGDKSGKIIGGKLFTNQYLLTYLSVSSLLQLEINFEANKSLQVWVKSSDDQYVLLGDVTFDNDGNAVLPGIEFMKSGSYEFIFVNSDKKNLDQPELVNKVSGLTVYVSE